MSHKGAKGNMKNVLLIIAGVLLIATGLTMLRQNAQENCLRGALESSEDAVSVEVIKWCYEQF